MAEGEDLPLVLTVYWLPGEYIEYDIGEMEDWEAIALMDRVRALIESAEVDEREEQE